MAEARARRRLSAILCADVVGFSGLMQEDEAGTLAALKAFRQEVFSPRTREHGGRVVKLMGDGALVEFASVVDAVTCAVAIQRDCAARADAEGTPPVRLRIGVNLGDIII